jgi:hypothetical protein
MVYHYTDDRGLRGILESGRLWLTDVFNLNDPSELRHGFSHAVTALNARAADGLPEAQTFARIFAAFESEGGIRESAHFFVCSMSSTGDDLGQWRAYADNGRGFALGFQMPALEVAFIQTLPQNNSTFRVVYDDARLADLHRRLVDLAFPLISFPRGRNLNSESIRLYMTELSVRLTLHALRAALFFKHEGYRNEQEYRFLEVHRAGSAPPPDVLTRSGPYGLVRYREFHWRDGAPNSLRQIVLGPAADPGRAPQFVQDCLRSFDLPGVEIVRSEIPYRVV